MLNKKFFAFSLIIVLNFLVSALVTTYFNHQTVNSSSLAPVQTPGAVAVASNEYTLNSSSFEDVPGMSLTTSPLLGGDLIITFSAENFLTITSTATTIITRCLVDGVPVDPGEVTLRNFLISLRANEVRNTALVFVARNVGPGVHQIRVQARRGGVSGGLTVRERTLTVVNVR